MALTIEKVHNPILGDDFDLICQAKQTKRGPVNLTDAKIWITFKTALSDADNAAALQKDSTTNPTYFTVTDAAQGRFEVSVPGTDIDDLSADTDYYVDVQVLTSGGALVSVVYDKIRFDQQVTKTTS